MMALELSDVIELHKGAYKYIEEQFPAKLYSILDIVCSVHGAFKQIARNHIRTCGCTECGKIKSSLSRTLGKDNYLERVNTIHSHKYTYDLSMYKNTQSTITIICKEHGMFTQKANKHLQGQGCMQCYTGTKKHTKDTFIALAMETHGELYDYSLVEYLGSKIPVSIICKQHGVFIQEPRVHLFGSGCQICGIDKKSFVGRYRDERPVTLYIVYLADLKIWKIGVTSRTIQERMVKISKEYTILLSNTFDTPSIAYATERVLLNMTKESGGILMKIPGYTEMRSSNPLDNSEVLQYLEEINKC